MRILKDKFIKSNKDILQSLIDKILTNEYYEDDVIYTINQLNSKFTTITFSENEVFNLFLDLCSFSSHFLEFEKYCRLIDKFAFWNNIFKDKFNIYFILIRMIWNKESISGAITPIRNYKDLECKINIINQLKHFKEITFDDIVNNLRKLTIELDFFKLEIEKYHKFINLFINSESFGTIDNVNIKSGSLRFQNSDFESAIKYYEKAALFYKQKNIIPEFILITEILSYIYLMVKNHDKSLKNYEKIIEIFKENKKWESLAHMYLIVAKLYFLQKDYGGYLEYCDKAIKIYENIDIRTNIAKLKCNIGIYFLNIGDLRAAKENFDLSIQILKENEKFRFLEYVYIYITNKLWKNKNYKDALKYYNDSIKLYNTLGKTLSVINIKNRIAKQEFKAKEYNKAFTTFEEIKSLYNDLDRRDDIFRIHRILGDIRLKQGKTEEAVKYYQDVIDYNEKDGALMDVDDLRLKISRLLNLPPTKVKNVKEKKSFGKYKKEYDFEEIFQKFNVKDKQEDIIEVYDKIVKQYIKHNRWGLAADAIIKISKIFSKNNLYENAIRFLRKAIECYLQYDKLGGVAQVNIILGNIYLKKRDFNTAIRHFEKANQIYVNQKKWNGAAQTKIQIAKIYTLLKNIQEAINYYEEAINYYKKSKNRKIELVSDIHFKIGELLHEQGLFEEAMKKVEKLKKSYIETAIWGEIANFYVRLAKFFFKNENETKSFKFLEKAKEIYEDLKDFNKLAYLCCLHGHFYSNSKMYEKSIENYELSLKKYQELKNEIKIAQVMVQLGRQYMHLKEYELSVEYFKNSLKYIKKGKDFRIIFEIANLIKQCFLNLCQFDIAITFIKNLINYYYREEEINNEIIISAKLSLGEIYSEIKDYKNAFNCFNEVQNDYNNIENSIGIAQILLIKGNLYLQNKDFIKSIESYIKIIKIYENNQKLEAVPLIYKKLGDVYLLIKKNKIAYQSFEKAIIFYKKIKDWEENGRINKLIGQIYLKLNHNEKAFEYYKIALEIFNRINDSNEIDQIYIEIGKLFLIRKNQEKGMEYFYKSLNRNILCERWDIVAEKNFNFACFFHELKDFKNSNIFFEKFIYLFIKYIEIEAFHKTISEFLQNMGESKKAIKIFNHYCDIYKTKENNLNLAVITELKAKMSYTCDDINREIETYEEAIEFYLKIEDYKNSIRLFKSIAHKFSLKNNNIEALQYYNKGIKLSKQFNCIDQIPSIIIKIENIFSKLNTKDEFTRFLHKLLENFEKLHNWEAISIIGMGLGDHYSKQEDKEKSLKYFLLALDSEKKNGNWSKCSIISLGIAKIYEELDKFNDAIVFYKDTIDFELKSEDSSNIGIKYFTIGSLLLKLDRYSEALEYCNKAIDSDTNHQNWKGLAVTYLKIGKIYFREEKYDEAIYYTNKSMEYSEFTDNSNFIPITLKKIGHSYFFLNKYEDALKHFQEALNLDIDNEEWSEAGYSSKFIGNIYLKLESYNDTLYYYDLAIKYYKKAKKWSEVSKMNNKTSKVYTKLNDYKNAIRYSKKIIKYSLKDDFWDNLAQTYFTIGNYYSKLTFYVEAYEYYELALKLDLKNKESFKIALSYRKLGYTALKKGNFKLAIKHLSTTKNYDIEDENWTGIAISYFMMGELHEIKEDYSKAINNYKRSIDYYTTAAEWGRAGSACIKIGRIYFMYNNFNLALNYFEQGKGLCMNESDYIGVAITSRKMGRIYSIQENYKEALIAYEDALKYSLKQNNFKAVATNYLILGEMLYKQQKYSEASNYYFKSIEFFEREDKWQDIAAVYSKIADCFKDQNLMEEAFKNLRIAQKIAVQSEDFKFINYLKKKEASFYRFTRDWEEAFKIYDSISIDYKRKNELNISYYFEIQSLKCRARIQENIGDFYNLLEIYSRISENYKKLHIYWFSAFYDLIHELFQADLTSQKGNHEECLIQLEILKERLESFQNNTKKKNLISLIRFRLKQVDMYYNREKAFVAEIEGDYDEASKYFQRCAVIAESLVSERFELDNRLYGAISKYYLAHSKRIEFQKFNLIVKNKLGSSKYLNDKILPLFEKAMKIFQELNQHLRFKNVLYEITLLTGKMLELRGEIGEAYETYNEAINLLKTIDESRVKQFTESLKLMKRKGFPMEKHFLRKPSLGSTFIDYCNLPEIELKERFFHLSFEELPLSLDINEDYMIKLKVELDDEYYVTFEDENYTINFVETNQRKQFFTNKESPTISFEFKIPAVKVVSKKIYQMELLDREGNYIKTKSFNIEFKDYTTDILEKPLKKESLQNYSNEKLNLIRDLLVKYRFQDLENTIEEILEKPIIPENKLFLKIFQDGIQGFNDYLEFHPKYALNKYIRAIKRIEENLYLISSNDEHLKFLMKLKDDYLIKFRNQLNKFKIDTKSNSKLENIHPIIIDIYYGKINSSNLKKDYTLTLQLTTAVFERIMDKLLYEKYKYNYDNFDWSSLPFEIVDEFKKVHSKQIKLNIDKIILKPKLEFESAKNLLIVIDPIFKEFCEKYSKILNIIRQARNKSYLEHGTKSVDDKTARYCLELIAGIKTFMNLTEETESLLNEQLESFNFIVNNIEINVKDKDFDWTLKKLEKQDLIIFISYSSDDVEFFHVRNIAENLKKYPLIKDVIYYQDTTLKYDNFLKFMDYNINKSDLLILFCSPNALNSRYVEREWTAADAIGKPIIPIFIKKTHIPTILRPIPGIEFDPFQIHHLIKEIYELIVRRVSM